MRNRSGVSLVEVIVAMTLLGVVLSSLAQVTFHAARRTSANTGDGYRQGVLMQEANRLATLPYASLPGLAGCITVAGGSFPHTRCTTVTAVTGNIRRVTVIVTPSQTRVRADTVIVDRSNAPVGNPLSIL